MRVGGHPYADVSLSGGDGNGRAESADRRAERRRFVRRDPFAAAAELGRKVIAGETLVPGMDYEGYETLKFDGKWVYGNSWHRLTLDTVDTYIAKWPEL